MPCKKLLVPAFMSILFLHMVIYKLIFYTLKSRVAPFCVTTFPLLCGALLLTEIVDDVRKELEVLNIKIESSHLFYWVDSTIVLAWINSETMFQVYISNQIARIRVMFMSTQLHDFPSKDNPLDLIT